MNEEDPFKPPNARLVDERVPESFRTGSLTGRRLSVAGWLSLAYAALGVPYALLSLGQGTPDGVLAENFADALAVILTCVWIYLLVVLRQLLESRFGLTGIAKYINSAISLTLLLTVLSFLVGDGDAEQFETKFVVFIVLLVPYGIVIALLGWRMLSIKVAYPYLRPFALMTIASGVSVASVVLALLSMVFDVIAAALLAQVLFHARRELIAADRGDTE